MLFWCRHGGFEKKSCSLENDVDYLQLYFILAAGRLTDASKATLSTLRSLPVARACDLLGTRSKSVLQAQFFDPVIFHPRTTVSTRRVD